ncbi:MAG TPA: TIR domain-containing protein [Pseudomonadales bacterium]
MDKPFPAYDGKEPYVFVSYSHEDNASVYPELQRLHDRGFNIWYDEGLRPGSEWHSELAQAIEDCSLCIFFVTPRSARSAHCQREVHYALDQQRAVLAVHLEPTELPSGLRFALSNIQAILRYELKPAQYQTKLADALRGKLQVANPDTPSMTTGPAPRRTWLYLAFALVAILAVAGAFAYFYHSTAIDAQVESAAAELPDGSVTVRSNWVAILPFRAVSAASETNLLAEGITGDLINAFSSLGMFSVVSHGTVRQFEGTSLDSGEIANRLNVRYLIEGRVQQSQEQVRVGVTLVDGIEGRTLWQQSKNYKGEDLLSVQEDVARFVSRALDVELVRLETERVRGLPVQSMQAWELYVSAMEVWEKGANEVNTKEAIATHRRALALEPDYVLSMAQLATLLVSVVQFGATDDPEATQAEACELAERVSRLGQDSPFAMFSAVHVLAHLCGQADRGVMIARRVVEAYPDSGYNHTLLGSALVYAGELDEALQVLEATERSFPHNEYVFRFTPHWKSMIFTEREAWQEVVAVSGASLNLSPDNYFDAVYLVNALAVLGQGEEANRPLTYILENWPGFTAAKMEWYLKQGLRSEERVEPYVRGLKLLGH